MTNIGQSERKTKWKRRGHHLPIYVDYLESTIGIREMPNKLLGERVIHDLS